MLIKCFLKFVLNLFFNFQEWLQAWAPARGEQGGQAPTLEKIRVGMAIAHPGNFSRGLKTSWQ